MDITVNEDNLVQVVQDMRNLMWEHILPRLVDLEMEIYTLRKHVWPWVQSQKEVIPLDRMKEKKDFFKDMNVEDIKILLMLKSVYHKKNGLCSSISKELEAITKPEL